MLTSSTPCNIDHDMPGKRPPPLSLEAVSALVLQYFPFKHVAVESFKSLPSYDDRNIYFRGEHNRIVGGPAENDGFVLKVLNSGISTSVAEGMNAMMLFLSDRGIPCSRPVPTRRGNHVLTASESDLAKHSSSGSTVHNPQCTAAYVVRVLTFIPGVPMDKLDRAHQTPELSYSVGEMVGRVDLALQDFSHSALVEREFRDWDLMYFTDVKQYIPHLRDEEKRKVAHSVVAMYEEHVLPLIPRMKKGIIHNDINGLNILFKVSPDKCDFCGLIDFGDSIHSCYLFELAIMLAYGMCEKENPVQFVGPMFRGYCDVFPLSEEELDCLYYAVLARLCQSAVIGEYQFTLEPWNTYLLTTPPEAWKLINMLLDLTKDRVEEIWGCARI